MSNPRRAELIAALEADNAGAVETLLSSNPELLNEPNERPAITLARTVATADALLNRGADLAAAGEWWKGGYCVREIPQDVGKLLVDRGAPLTVHVAAGLGLAERLAKMLDADPALIDAKGVDACTPLHFARDVATANVLLDHGSRIDARDEDHESTPAQWSIKDAPEVSRFLLERGSTPDIFLAAALGDRELAKRLIDADPACVSHRIGKLPEFPPIGFKRRGGTIYQWTLAFNSFPHQVALLKGHEELFEYLYERSDTTTRFLVACVLARRAQAEAIAAANPGIVSTLSDADLELPARYCWETNTNYDAVKLMLDLGFMVAHPENSHGYTPLHNAAWSGSADLVDLLLERGHPVDILDPGYHSTPLGYAIYDCTVEKRHPEGEFGRVAKSLIDAGSPWDAFDYPLGDAQIDEVLRPLLPQRVEGAAMLGDEAALDRLLGAAPSEEVLNNALAGAARGGNPTLCRRLIAQGAQVNSAAGRNSFSPLMFAAWSQSHETVALLIDQGADVVAKNVNGSTALHVAVARGASLKTIDLLLRSGAHVLVEMSNNWGYTPLRAAREQGRDDVVRRLTGS